MPHAGAGVHIGGRSQCQADELPDDDDDGHGENLPPRRGQRQPQQATRKSRATTSATRPQQSPAATQHSDA
jgi:hypothetical protein